MDGVLSIYFLHNHRTHWLVTSLATVLGFGHDETRKQYFTGPMGAASLYTTGAGAESSAVHSSKERAWPLHKLSNSQKQHGKHEHLGDTNLPELEAPQELLKMAHPNP